MKRHQFWTVKNEDQKKFFIEHVEKLCKEYPYVEFEWSTARNRTQKQSAALHVFFRNTAEALNENDLDCEKVLAEGVSGIRWTPELVKEYIWRVVQKTQTDKESTRDLDRGEVSQIYDIINKHLSTKFGLHIPFPEKLK